MTKATSIEAYMSILESGLLGKQCRTVAKALATSGPLSGREVDELLQSTSAHKRLSDLGKMGVAKVVSSYVDNVTKKRVERWALVEGAIPSRAPKAKKTAKKDAHEPTVVPPPATPAIGMTDQEALQEALSRLRTAQEDVRTVLARAKLSMPLTAAERAVGRLLSS